MKTYIILVIVLVFQRFVLGQVGINIEEPQAMLDVNGNLKIRSISTVSEYSNDYTVLIRDNSAEGDFEIKEMGAELLDSGASVYTAKKTGGWGLITLGIGGGWQKLNLTGASDTKLGNPNLFVNGVYTAPETGNYMVSYDFQLLSGVNLEALGGRSLGILKNNTIWEQKVMNAVRVSLLGVTIAAIPITNTKLTTLVHLQKGETITFAVNTTGLLPIDITLLSNSEVTLEIFKISN